MILSEVRLEWIFVRGPVKSEMLVCVVEIMYESLFMEALKKEDSCGACMQMNV